VSAPGGRPAPLPGPALDRFLAELVAAGPVSGVSALVGTPGTPDTPGGIEWQGSAGSARPGLPESDPNRSVSPATRFDFGSLTKPFLATLALVLDASGELPLVLPVGEVWPAAAPRLAPLPLADLLRHRAGFAAWTPLYYRCRSPADVLSLLLGGELLGAPPGTYSDLDYLLWGRAAEARLGVPLETLLAERVLRPLGLTGVSTAPGDRPGVAQSLMGTGKEVELAAGEGMTIADLGPPPPGVVQDGNARFLAGFGMPLPGNAGLFGTAADLFALAVEWLRPGRLLSLEARERALAGTIDREGLYALGWVRRNVAGSAGGAIGPRSFGHSGFAGGSLWIDPERQRILVLLSARTDPAGDLNLWRRRFHALAYDEGTAVASGEHTDS